MRPFSRIDRYLCRAVLGAAGVVLLAFTALIAVFALIEELDEGQSAYGLLEAAWYVFLTLPRRAWELLPYVLFLGSLIGLGKLASQSELVALRAAGLSVRRLTGAAAWAVALAWTLGVAVGEWIAPATEALAEAHKARILRDSAGLRGSVGIEFKGGYWYREGSLYMHVEALDGNGDLLGVRQYWLNDRGRLSLTREAARAEYLGAADAGVDWLLRDGVETHLSDDQLVARPFSELAWRGQIDPDLISERLLVDARKLSLLDLRRQIGYLQREGLDATSQLIAFWSKCLQPASLFGLVLLALACVLGPLRDVSIGVRISAGIVVGLSFKYLQDLFAPMAVVYELAPSLAVGIPIALCWALGILGLRRVS